MFTDRYGNELQATTGSKNFNLGTDVVTLSWSRQGNVVTYNISGNLSSSSGSRYGFTNFLPYKHDNCVSVISSFVGQTDIKTYGDLSIAGKDLALYLPKYESALTIRSTLTVVVVD